MDKILVIRYGTIGDTIFASAFYRELRKNLPNAQIDALVDGVAESIMLNCPYINNLIKLKKKYRDFFYYYRLFKNYDTIFFLKNDNFLSKVAFLARVKNRIGFDVRRNFRLTKTAPYKNDKHEIDFYLDLLKVCGYKVENDKTEMWVSPSEKVEETVNNRSGKKVLIHASSRFPQKNWNKANWAKVIEYLAGEKSANIFFVGGNSDNEYYSGIGFSNADINSKVINLCGMCNIQETMSLVSKMDLVLGIDSGVIHMAAASDIPSILLNGPTSLVRWQPRSEKCTVLTKNYECSPCMFASSRNKRCKNKAAECMEAITYDEVINAINNVLI